MTNKVGKFPFLEELGPVFVKTCDGVYETNQLVWDRHGVFFTREGLDASFVPWNNIQRIYQNHSTNQPTISGS